MAVGRGPWQESTSWVSGSRNAYVNEWLGDSKKVETQSGGLSLFSRNVPTRSNGSITSDTDFKMQGEGCGQRGAEQNHWLRWEGMTENMS